MHKSRSLKGLRLFDTMYRLIRNVKKIKDSKTTWFVRVAMYMKGGNAYIMLFKLGIYFIAIGIVKFIIYFIKKMGIKNAER